MLTCCACTRDTTSSQQQSNATTPRLEQVSGCEWMKVSECCGAQYDHEPLLFGSLTHTHTQEDAPAVAALRQLSRELIDSCAHAGHTYLHAQQLLLAAAEECPQGGAVCLRLSQDLQAATTAQYPAAWGTMVGVEMCVACLTG